MNILTEAVADMKLDWAAPEQLSKHWMDGSFLGHRHLPLSSLSSTKSSLVHGAPLSQPEPMHRELSFSRHWRGQKKKGMRNRLPFRTPSRLIFVHPGVGKLPHCLLSHVELQLTSLKRRTFLQDPQHAALHRMAVLQVFQTRLLRSLDKEGPDPESNLRTAADLALAASKKVTQGIGCSKGRLVVLHHHLWLTLTEIRDAEKKQLLNAPVTVEAFFEEYTEALKQSKKLLHLLPKRSNAPTRSRSR